MNERQLFESALEIADLQTRQAFLDEACGSDAVLRARVEGLLKSHASAGSFLDTPAADQLAQGVDNITTNTIVGDPAVDQDADRAPAEAEFRKYLQPATRTGWLGRLGHYEIEAILGRGAFGIVAKAFDEKLHRVVAIKLLNPELAATSPPRKRFLREARTAAAVTHENIVAIFAVEEEPIPYLVMEYVPGKTLQQRMDEQGPLEVSDVLRIGQQVAAGLAAAHSAHLIHRDIKPSNILLAEGPHERAKISDFGLARAVDDASLTSSGLIAGTPMYMAPEQARGETLDHRADLFSLGSVLYQMASGRPPFRAANTVAVLKRVCEDTPRPLDDVIPGIPGWLETIIFKLLEKKREDRYQSAREVADLMARCQSELQHQGRVICVPGRTAPAAETQELPARKGDRSVPDRRPIGWWVGAVVILVVLGVIAVLITTPGGGRQATKQESSNANSGSTASATNAKGWHGWPADAPKPAIAPFDAAQAEHHQKEWAAYLKVPVEYTNSIGMKFRLIPPGEFMMGSTDKQIEALLKQAGDDIPFQEHLNAETPMKKVILTQPIFLGVNEVTQAEYEKVMGINPSQFAQLGPRKNDVVGLNTADHPVEMVSWNDAAEFCAKLSKQEKLKPFYFRTNEFVTTLKGNGYQLPSSAQWEFACRSGTTTTFWIGDSDEELINAGWLGVNSGGHTHAVGELKANPFGLHDMHGNVWEWVQDGWDASWHAKTKENSVINPSLTLSNDSPRLVRGGDWGNSASRCRSSSHFAELPARKEHCIGFRLSLPVDAVRQAFKLTGPALPEAVATTPLASASAKSAWHGWPADAPKPAIAPFDSAQAEQHQKEWAAYLKVPVEYTNSIGMKFRLIPPGEFLMGSTLEEIETVLKDAPPDDKFLQACVKSGAPQHKVILTKPIYLGTTEVTQAEYEKVMGVNPAFFSVAGEGKAAVAGLETAALPVERVSWNDAAEFCAKLSQQEKLKPFYFRAGEMITPLDGTGYRLPSEAEWEFACRAGTITRYWTGDKTAEVTTAGWFQENAGGRTHASGELKPNPFHLYDVHGNLAEWVQDWLDPEYYQSFQQEPAINPGGPIPGSWHRVVRGGYYSGHHLLSLASYRQGASDGAFKNVGFRVALKVDAVTSALTERTTTVTGSNSSLARLARRCSEAGYRAVQCHAGKAAPGRMGRISESTDRVHQHHRHEVPPDPAG